MNTCGKTPSKKKLKADPSPESGARDDSVKNSDGGILRYAQNDRERRKYAG
jgi:hypothetical protein